MATSRIKYLGGEPVKQFALFYDRVTDEGKDAVRQAAEDGALVMKQMIEDRGTGRAWSGDFGSMAHGHEGRLGGFNGRVASGKMRDDVTYTYTESGKGNAVARFGWLNGAEDYYKYQEGGFTHSITGREVEGMYALQDSRDWVIGDLKARLKRGA